MIHKKQFSQLLKQVARRKQGLHDPQIMHPHRDWYIGLVIAGLIFLGSAYLSSYLYTKNKNLADESENNEVIDVVLYRDSQVKAALSIFAGREQMRSVILGDRAGTPEDVSTEPVVTLTEIVDVTISTTTPEDNNDIASPEPILQPAATNTPPQGAATLSI
jgi:hypothetical protein